MLFWGRYPNFSFCESFLFLLKILGREYVKMRWFVPCPMPSLQILPKPPIFCYFSVRLDTCLLATLSQLKSLHCASSNLGKLRSTNNTVAELFAETHLRTLKINLGGTIWRPGRVALETTTGNLRRERNYSALHLRTVATSRVGRREESAISLRACSAGCFVCEKWRSRLDLGVSAGLRRRVLTARHDTASGVDEVKTPAEHA